MSDAPDAATVASVKHYLDRAGHLLRCLAANGQAERVLRRRLTPDMFDTGFHFAVAIQFAARALCPPAGIALTEFPETHDIETLLNFQEEVARLIAPLDPGALTQAVTHRAGEAELRQGAADYIARFALPNLIFHLSMAYAGLRQAGIAVGKADFDGLHHY